MAKRTHGRQGHKVTLSTTASIPGPAIANNGTNMESSRLSDDDYISFA